VENSTKFPITIKIHPDLIFASIRHKNQAAGAFWIWHLARELDPSGSSRTSAADLREFCDYLGIHERRRRRWMEAARKLGILTPGGKWFYYVDRKRAALAVDAPRIGNPVSVNAIELFKRGGRGLVLAAFLVTRRADKHPMSQEKRAEITGISARVQRNWLNGRSWKTKKGETVNPPLEVTRRKNYAKTYWKSNQIAGIRRELGYNLFRTTGGKVYQRLPDLLTVPEATAKTSPRYRTRKCQRKLNALYCLEQSNQNRIRLFHETPEAAREQQKRLIRKQINSDVFELVSFVEERDRNLWIQMPTS
jgi:hypothetical protein